MQNSLIQNFGSKLPKQGPGPPSLVCPRSVAVQSAAHLRGSEDAGGGTWLCTEPTAPAPACTAHCRELKKKGVRVLTLEDAARCSLPTTLPRPHTRPPPSRPTRKERQEVHDDDPEMRHLGVSPSSPCRVRPRAAAPSPPARLQPRVTFPAASIVHARAAAGATPASPPHHRSRPRLPLLLNSAWIYCSASVCFSFQQDDAVQMSQL